MMIAFEHGLVIAALCVFVTVTVIGAVAKTRRYAGAVLALGTGVNLAALVVRTFSSGHLPFANQYESLLFTAFGAAVMLTVLWLRKTHTGMVLPLVPLLTALQLVTLVFYAEPGALVPVLRSRWLMVHVSIIMLSYAALFLSFGCALLYLVGTRFPGAPLVRSLENPVRLERISYRLVTIGYPLLLAGILTGAVWAKQAWGRYWGWDPKETWALVTWLAYTVYLHVRLRGRGAAVRAAWVNVIAFLCVVFTYFGVNYLLAGLHSYAR